MMIKPENLFELMAEPDWSEETQVSDTMAEYMRRAAEESGEPEIVHLDATKGQVHGRGSRSERGGIQGLWS